MPPDAAQLIRWIDLGDLTPAEVAAILGREVGTVRVQHHRARKQFRDLAERLDEDEERGAA
jgi:DNA-directed RNA polymerase specialized sigma24 family protein